MPCVNGQKKTLFDALYFFIGSSIILVQKHHKMTTMTFQILFFAQIYVLFFCFISEPEKMPLASPKGYLSKTVVFVII